MARTTKKPAPRMNQLRQPLAKMPVEQKSDVLDEALKRYQSGNWIKEIAADLGVSEAALYAHLVREREQEWKDAKVARTLCELEDAQRTLRDAKDMLEANKAERLIRSAQWQLERLLRNLYGQNAPETDKKRITITLNIGAGAPHRIVAEQPRRLAGEGEKDAEG